MRSCVRVHGEAPSLREIGAGPGLSRSAVLHPLERLEALGAVARRGEGDGGRG
jgi:DNA-binding IclR family transcriptional regulator